MMCARYRVLFVLHRAAGARAYGHKYLGWSKIDYEILQHLYSKLGDCFVLLPNGLLTWELNYMWKYINVKFFLYF